MNTVNPYLTFKGNCKEAFDFYKSIFGGEFTMVSKFKDMPGNPEYPISEADKEKIMHVSLPISKETILMGSDTSEQFSPSIVVGTNITLSINSDSVEEVTRIYNALSEGGIIKMKLEKTFWGAYFGMFTDKFDIHWMVNCELEEHKEYEAKNRKG